MQILDFYPDKGNFVPGELVRLIIRLDRIVHSGLMVRIKFIHLDVLVEEKTFPVENYRAGRTLVFEWHPETKPAGYGAEAALLDDEGNVLSLAQTAFDVLSKWTDHPRYGFITEFQSGRLDPEAAIQQLTRFHINGLQFYDWQYRHDTLVAPSDEYIDPLGRPISLSMVRKLVDSAHRHGMACMPYIAVYAASAEFWKNHMEWALYDEGGAPIAFGENFLGLMDPSLGSSWSKHLLHEAGKALKEIPFNGIHIDQYGNPRQAWDSHGNAVDLPLAFMDFISAAHQKNPGKAILFNAVENWPIESIANACVDFLYIEVWPPEVEYLQLAQIVLEAVRLSSGKPVTIALYLPASHVQNILLVDALIMACGGIRIELGEGNRLLVDPYFPNHAAISSELDIELRRYYDFAVRYGEWLFGYQLPPVERKRWSHGELNSNQVRVDKSVWTVWRQYPDGISIAFANLQGIEPQKWNEAHSAPIPFDALSVMITHPKKPGKITWATPDQVHGSLALDFTYDQGTIYCNIPHLLFTGVLYIHD